jgi:hypothetical protein
VTLPQTLRRIKGKRKKGKREKKSLEKEKGCQKKVTADCACILPSEGIGYAQANRAFMRLLFPLPIAGQRKLF